ncbi:MAG: hypothetical protein ACYDB3_02060, partial [Acidimicrobiales bacterium]
AVTCTSATYCIAVGSNTIAYTSDGVDWGYDTSFSNIGGVGAVTCSSAQQCVIAGSKILQGSIGNWTDVTPAGMTRSIIAVSCVDASHCYGVTPDVAGGTMLVSNTGIVAPSAQSGVQAST